MGNQKPKINPVKLRYFIINKPYGTICQFTPEGQHSTLKELYDFPSDIYSVGRLDTDSEGLLIITNDNFLKTRLTDPKFKHKKTYWVQLDNAITSEALNQLEKGITISIKGKKHHTAPAIAKILEDKNTLKIQERAPPIRSRKNIPTSWISLQLTEGKNRQVRRMTAGVDFPTLRLIRHSIENLTLDHLEGKIVKEVKKEWLYKMVNL